MGGNLKKERITKALLLSKIGQKFGKWTILEFINKPNTGVHPEYRYKLQCECGVIKTPIARFVLYGETTQCLKCHNKQNALNLQKDITNQRFGKLVAIKQHSQTKSQNWRWLCKCDCGEDKIAEMRFLNSGYTYQCNKCHFKAKETYSLDWALGKVQNSAKRRKLQCNLTVQYLEDLYKKQQGLCALSGRKLTKYSYKQAKNKALEKNISLDRIDSSKGYIEGNVQWVHRDINWGKNAQSDKDFIQMCQEVVDYQKTLGNIKSN